MILCDEFWSVATPWREGRRCDVEEERRASTRVARGSPYGTIAGLFHAQLGEGTTFDFTSPAITPLVVPLFPAPSVQQPPPSLSLQDARSNSPRRGVTAAAAALFTPPPTRPIVSAMHLFQVSVDALSEIASYLHFLDLANLWFTGCTTLHSKFASGGVSRLRLPVNPDIRTFHWPSLIAHLHKITQFCMYEIQSTDTPLFRDSYFDTLPSTLRILDLRCSGALYALNDLLAREPGAFPMLATLKISIFQVGTKREQLQLQWPQSLTSIFLDGNSNPLPHLTLSNLPENLVSLDGKFHTIDDPAVGFPSTLVSLKLRLTHVVNFFPALPQELEVLCIQLLRVSSKKRSTSTGSDPGVPESFWRDDAIPRLPKGLKVLQLPIAAYSREILRQLPTSLTELIHRSTHGAPSDVPYWPPHLVTPWRLLPPQITKLIASEIPSSVQTFEEVEVAADALPHLSSRTLSHVQLVGTGSSLASELEYLGISKMGVDLESISIPMATNFPFSALPAKLTSLAIQHGPLTPSAIESLPDTLLKLKIHSGPLSSSPEDWKLLPRTLRDLALDACEWLSSDSSFFLPRSLTSLSISKCTRVPEKWFERLPPGLRNLALSVQCISPFRRRLKLPQTLGTFSLSFSRAPTDRHAMVKIFMSLPSSLSSLCLSLPVGIELDIADDHLSLLPRRMRRLQLPHSAKLSAQCLRFLPASLESISIGHSYSMSQFKEESAKQRSCMV